jgi:Asp-tRNA(Asn)/Glu-tRNA(Gln) amidotransferase A subunit family amidase
VQLVDLAVDHQRMAGVVPALKATDHVGPLAEPIDDLALALVAPLRADDHDICHFRLIVHGPRGPKNRGEL